MSPGERPGSFVEWIKRLVPRTTPDPRVFAAFVSLGVEIGVNQCLQFGVTTVGDISRQCGMTRPLLQAGPLRVVSYGEVQAMAQRRGLLDERIALAIDRTNESECLRVGISPHAPVFRWKPKDIAGRLRYSASMEYRSRRIWPRRWRKVGFSPTTAAIFAGFGRLSFDAWDEDVPKSHRRADPDSRARWVCSIIPRCWPT